jgi:hypothetical protein
MFNVSFFVKRQFFEKEVILSWKGLFTSSVDRDVTNLPY